MTAEEMLSLIQDSEREEEEEEEVIECAIFCIDHQGPCLHDTCLIPVHMRRNSTDPLVAVQLLERGAYDTVRPDMAFTSVLDAGGNCGVSAIVFATMFPTATIVVVEPSSSNFRMLKLNTHLYPNVIPLRVALWPRVARLALTKGQRTPGKTEWGYMVHEIDQVPPSLPILSTLLGVPVSLLLRLSSLPSFDLLKIDIEGSEKEVLGQNPKNPKNFKNPKNPKPYFLDMGTKMAIVEVHEDMREGAREAVREAFRERGEGWRWERQWEEYHVYKRRGWDEGGGP